VYHVTNLNDAGPGSLRDALTSARGVLLVFFELPVFGTGVSKPSSSGQPFVFFSFGVRAGCFVEVVPPVVARCPVTFMCAPRECAA
jgi:hypothetical protein